MIVLKNLRSSHTPELLRIISTFGRKCRFGFVSGVIKPTQFRRVTASISFISLFLKFCLLSKQVPHNLTQTAFILSVFSGMGFEPSGNLYKKSFIVHHGDKDIYHIIYHPNNYPEIFLKIFLK